MKSRLLLGVSVVALTVALGQQASAANVVVNSPQGSLYINYDVDGDVINNSVIGTSYVAVDIDGGPVITGDIVNNGTISGSNTGLLVDSTNLGGAIRNDGLVQVSTTWDGDFKGIQQYASSATINDLDLFNSGTVEVIAGATDVDATYASVSMDVDGIEQTGSSWSSAETNLNLSNSGDVTVDVTGNAIAAVNYAYATGWATGLDQYGSNSGTGDVDLTLSNSGNVDVDVSMSAAVAAGGYGYADADATGIYQEAYTNSGSGNAYANLTNSGSVSAKASSDFSLGTDANGDFYSYAEATGVDQYANAYWGDAVLTATNSGTVFASADADLTFGDGDGYYAYASAEASGIYQDAYTYDGDLASVELTNTGDITAISRVDVQGGSDSYTYAYSDAYGVYQTAEADDYGDAEASLTNSGGIFATAEIEMLFGASGTLYARATAIAAYQSVDAYYTADAAMTNSGTVEAHAYLGLLVGASAGQTYTDAMGARAVGLEQDVYGGSYAHAMVDNSGTVLVESTAEAELGANTSFRIEASATGISQDVNSNWWYSSGEIDNSGEVLVSARGSLETMDAAELDVQAYGVAQFANAWSSAYGSVVNSGLVDVEATGYATGYNVDVSATAVGVLQRSTSPWSSFTFDNSGDIYVDATATAYGSTAYADARAVGYRGIVDNSDSTSFDVTNSGYIGVDADAYASDGAYAEAIGLDFQGGQIGGSAVNTSQGYIGASAYAGGTTESARAIGVRIQADDNNFTFTNEGSIYVVADGASAAATGIFVGTDPSGASFGTSAGTVVNNGGSITAWTYESSWQRGTAINAAGAGDVLISLMGEERDGSIFGDILLNSAAMVEVTNGETLFDGVMNSTLSYVGSLDIFDDGVFRLANNASYGPSLVYVDDFTVQSDGTIAFTLGQNTTTAGVDYGQVNAVTANLAGTIKAHFEAAWYDPNGTMTYVYEDVIVSGTRNGTFDQTTSNTPLMTVVASYDGNNVDLTATRNDFGSVAGLTENQQAVADYIDEFYALAGMTAYQDLLASFFALDGMEAYQAMLDQLAGAEHVQALQSQLGSFNQLNAILADRLSGPVGGAGPLAYAAEGRNGSPASKVIATNGGAGGGMSMWAKGFGSIGTADGDLNGPGFDSTQGGVYAGVDASVGSTVTLGLAGGYVATSLDFDSGNSVTYSGYQIAGYGKADNGTGYLRGVVGYGGYSNESTRHVVINNVLETAHGDYDSSVFNAYGEAGYRLLDSAGMNLTPFAGLGYAYGASDGFTETGLSAGNLDVESASGSSLVSSLGVQFEGRHMMGDKPVKGRVRLAWEHEFLDGYQSLGASFVGAPGGTGFTVVGANASRDFASVVAGGTFTIAPMTDLSVNYQGRFSSDFQENSLSLTLQQKF